MTGFTFSFVATVFFILYTPNIVFKSFVKNKSVNLLICCLFFTVSIYLVNFILNQGFIEGFEEGLTTVSESCNRAQNAFGNTNTKLDYITNSSSNNTYSGLGGDKSISKDIDEYKKDYGNYVSKTLCSENSKTKKMDATMPPDLDKIIKVDASAKDIVDDALKKRLDCFKNNILNGKKFDPKNFTCSSAPPAVAKTTTPPAVAQAAAKPAVAQAAAKPAVAQAAAKPLAKK